MANEIELIVRGKDEATPALEKVQGGLAGVDKSSEQAGKGTKGLGISLTDLKSGVDLAIGAFNTFKGAAEAAFNFAREGAVINQTTASFESMKLSIDALRAAAHGTVDDMTLMSGSLTLLAGSSGEVREAFANGAPQLMEMAKAANKLNPTLGDTTFMFESIATAAKRQSAMIADNLGIVVKQGEAYQKYADSIGVAVEQLTAEQKQIAFLNGLLEAGNVLIEQAGGSTESAADSYAILTTHVKNLTAATKANVAEAIGPAIGALAQHVQAVDALSNSTEGYKKKKEGLINILTGNSKATEQYNEMLRINATAAERATQQAQYYFEQQALVNSETKKAPPILDEASIAFLEYEDALQNAVSPMRVFEEVMMATTKETNLLKAAMQGALGQEIEGFTQKQAEASAKVSELSGKVAELEGKRYLTTAQKAELEEMRTKLDEAKGAIEENAAKHEEATRRILFGFMEQRLAMDGLTQAELMALQEVATEWGLMDRATLTAIKGIDAVASAFEDGKIQVGDFGGMLAEVAGILSGLPREHTFVMNYVETGPGPGGTPGAKRAAEGREQMYAEGGLVQSSGLSLVGENGPELVRLPAGSRVLDAQKTAQAMAGQGDGGVVINVQATINNGMDAEVWAARIGEIAGQRARSRAMGVI